MKFCWEREDPRKNQGPAGIRTHNLLLSRQMLLQMLSGAEIGVGEAQAISPSL